MDKILNDLSAGGQIKSRERVASHGEVFTADREVNVMLDLVKQETERIDSRFLEPACGNGNFLAEILRRKLSVVNNLYSKVRRDYELNALISVASLYGIELLPDNVEECKKRLFDLFSKEYNARFKNGSEEYFSSVKYILDRNILCGDALTLCTPEDNQPIIFSEWSVIGYKIKRRDYTLDMLLKNQLKDSPNLVSDLGKQAFIPEPIREFKVIPYNKIYNYENLEL